MAAISSPNHVGMLYNIEGKKGTFHFHDLHRHITDITLYKPDAEKKELIKCKDLTQNFDNHDLFYMHKGYFITPKSISTIALSRKVTVVPAEHMENSCLLMKIFEKIFLTLFTFYKSHYGQ